MQDVPLEQESIARSVVRIHTPPSFIRGNMQLYGRVEISNKSERPFLDAMKHEIDGALQDMWASVWRQIVGPWHKRYSALQKRRIFRRRSKEFRTKWKLLYPKWLEHKDAMLKKKDPQTFIGLSEVLGDGRKVEFPHADT